MHFEYKSSRLGYIAPLAHKLTGAGEQIRLDGLLEARLNLRSPVPGELSTPWLDWLLFSPSANYSHGKLKQGRSCPSSYYCSYTQRGNYRPQGEHNGVMKGRTLETFLLPFPRLSLS